MGGVKRALGGAVALAGVGFAARGALAGSLPLVADEAYYWVWSLQPSMGYYDQPPVVAWLVAAGERTIGHTEIGVRALFLACAAVVTAAPWGLVGDRRLWALFLAGPALFGLTALAVPDAPLLAGWAVTLAAAARGGRWWWLAGAAAGFAFQAKYSGLAVFPLAVVAAGRPAWRSRDVALGTLIACAISAPNLLWNAEHHWVSFAFPWQEAIAHPKPRGIAGIADFALAQVAAVGPMLPFVAAVWAVASVPALRRDAVLRLMWLTSVPVLALFAAASLFGPTEAHWTAPAWLSLCIGMTRATPRWTRALSVSAWLGLVTSLAVVAQIHRPILDLPVDPGARFREGPALADAVAAWALPEGATIADDRGREATMVWTERYQEAALVHFYAGIPAHHHPACGRADQYTLTGRSEGPARALYLRPTTGGEPHCILGSYPTVVARHRLAPIDPLGGRPGPWDLFELQRDAP